MAKKFASKKQKRSNKRKQQSKGNGSTNNSANATTDISAPARLRGGDGFPRFRMATPFPERMRIKMAFSNWNDYTTAASVFGAEVIFRLNSVFQPLSGGASPYGYTAMATLYDYYRVYGVGIDLTFSNPSVDGIWAGAMISPTSNTTTLAGLALQTADAYSVVDARPCNNTGTQTVRIQKYFNIWTAEGIPKSEWQANTNYQAQGGHAPSFAPALRVAVAHRSSTTATLQCITRLTFDVEFSHRLIQ